MKGILFVCIGNRLRSVIAEHIFRSLLVQADQDLARKINISSAGVIGSECFECGKRRGVVPAGATVAAMGRAFFGKPPASSAVAAMAKRGIDISGYRTREIDIAMIESADLILTAVKANKHGVLELCPAAEGKVFTLMEFIGEELYYMFDDCYTIAPELRCYKADFGNAPVVTEALIAEVKESLTKAMPKILDHLKA